MMGSKTAYMANFELFPYQPSSFEDPYEALDPSYQFMHYSHASSFYPSEAFTLPEAYIANVEGSTDEWWYLDSGATHHITNNMANMHMREEFKGSDQLTIGNGQGLDSLKGQVLLQGLAEKGLYRLLLKSSQSPSSFVCQVSSN
ncbi:hypothetical protein AB3S75_007151 [Citrus x aurantiifolia]